MNFADVHFGVTGKIGGDLLYVAFVFVSDRRKEADKGAKLNWLLRIEGKNDVRLTAGHCLSIGAIARVVMRWRNAKTLARASSP